MSTLEPRERRPAPVPRAAIVEAAGNLEREIGGRAELVRILLNGSGGAESGYVAGLLADPDTEQMALGEVLLTGHVPLQTLVKLLNDSRLARAHAIAMDRVAAKLPNVAEGVMDAAIDQRKPCFACNELGKVLRVDETDPDGAPKACQCEVCGGAGSIVIRAEVADRKLALELGRLVTKTPGVSVNVQQTNQSASFSGGLSFDDLTRATDDILYPPTRARSVGRSSTSSPVTTTPHPPAEDGSSS